MNESTKELYEARVKRFHDAVSLKRPDRVPIATVSGHFFYKYAGLTPKMAMYDYESAANGMKASITKFQWDMTPSVSMNPGPVMEIFGLTQYKWPGYDLPDDVDFQFVEGEYMSADEYDELLSNPEGFTIRKLMPRMSKLLEPLADLPPFHWLSNGNALVRTLGTLAGSPPIAQILESIQKAGAEMTKYNEVRAGFVEEMKGAGFPMMAGAGGMAPFDWITDFLRGMRGTMLDMYRNPDKLLGAIDLFTPMLIENALKAAKRSGNPL